MVLILMHIHAQLVRGNKMSKDSRDIYNIEK